MTAASPEDAERQLAELVTAPALAAERVILGAEAKADFGDKIDVPHLMAELRRQAEAVNRGDLTLVEAMLMNQATALQSLFVRLAERAMPQETVAAFEVNMRMALRAQSQCRATLEALAAIKNPPIVIARQANIAQGPQQVNNCTPAPPRTREIESAPIGQLEAGDGERLDARPAGAAIRSDQAMAPVGVLDGATDDRG